MSIDRTPATQPPVWIITHRGKPVTLGNIHKFSAASTDWFQYEWERAQYLAGRSRKEVVERFLHYYGGLWINRHKNYDVKRLLSS